MTPSHCITLLVIAIIQSFMAGYWLRDQWGWAKSRFEKFKVIFGCLLTLALGIPALIVIVIAGIFAGMWRSMEKRFNLYFIVKYIVFKRPLNYNKKGGDVMHKRALALRPKWYQISDLIFVWIDKWVYRNYGEGKV